MELCSNNAVFGKAWLTSGFERNTMRELSDSRQTKSHNVLGGRFIERTRNELSVMCYKWSALRNGDREASEQLLQFAHRIGGTGAMLGLEQVSEPARSIERILRAGVLSADDWQEIDSRLQDLYTAVIDAEESLMT